MKKYFFSIFWFVFCFVSLGCGYTTSSNLSSHLKTVHVENFKNSIDFTEENRRNIYLPLLEVDVRNALIDRFLFDGNLKIAEADMADLVIKGELKGYERQVLRYTDDDDVEEYRVQIIVAFEVWDNTIQDVMISEPSFGGEATYFLTGPNATSEESAVDEAMEDLARRIVARIIENW